MTDGNGGSVRSAFCAAIAALICSTVPAWANGPMGGSTGGSNSPSSESNSNSGRDSGQGEWQRQNVDATTGADLDDSGNGGRRSGGGETTSDLSGQIAAVGQAESAGQTPAPAATPSQTPAAGADPIHDVGQAIAATVTEIKRCAGVAANAKTQDELGAAEACIKAQKQRYDSLTNIQATLASIPECASPASPAGQACVDPKQQQASANQAQTQDRTYREDPANDPPPMPPSDDMHSAAGTDFQ